MTSLKIVIAAWAALGLIGRSDALNAMDILCSHIDILPTKRVEYKPLTDWVVQECFLTWPDKKRTSVWFHESSPISYLWYALQRMNLVCELLDYQEQEELLEELLSGKFKKCALARLPECVYN